MTVRHSTHEVRHQVPPLKNVIEQSVTLAIQLEGPGPLSHLPVQVRQLQEDA